VHIVFLLLCFLIVPGFAVAGDEEKVEPVLEYLEMTPKFTVNLAGQKKYLLINVQLLFEGKENVEKIKKHMPALRHELIMLFSGRNETDLASMEQREALRKETLDAIRAALDKYENSDGFRDLFFTEFLLN
jgi:flagellar FliL protein